MRFFINATFDLEDTVQHIFPEFPVSMVITFHLDIKSGSVNFVCFLDILVLGNELVATGELSALIPFTIR